MEKKRLFEVLDDMNQSDTENKTRLLQLSNAFVSGKTVRQGAVIEMGVEASCLVDILAQKSIPILLIVDKEDYFKRKDLERPKTTQAYADQEKSELVEALREALEEIKYLVNTHVKTHNTFDSWVKDTEVYARAKTALQKANP